MLRYVRRHNKSVVGINSQRGNFLVLFDSGLYPGLQQTDIQLAAYGSDYFIEALIENGDDDSDGIGIFSHILKGGGVGYPDYLGVGAGNLSHDYINYLGCYRYYLPGIPCQGISELPCLGRAYPTYVTGVHAI